MSFQSPIYLLALLAVPASIAIYVFADRRRRAGAARFASPALMPSVAPAGPGFRRHLPLLFYVVALAAVAFAMARPEATVAVPEERAAVVLTTDVSGSMEARDVRPSRMTAVRRAALEFLEDAPDELRIGAVAFNHAVRRVEPPRAERDDTRALIQDLSPSGGTATGEGLAAAVGLMSRQGAGDRRRPPAAVILLSDGTSTHGRDPLDVARQAARLRIPIYTVAFGTDGGTIEVQGRDGSTTTRRVPPDRETMRRVATISGARTFNANAGAELATVYERLGSQVATREERREVTAAFAGGAAAFLLLGGAMSLRWFGRLP
ncbi:MAG TPA: VWA domain-containing protein [Thermoleophilaceae bacterium]|nr:VWA domain-containing protein [Thermoleophilaceae bacterium]